MVTRTAVLGLGGIAAEHLTKLRRIEGVEVVGVCDLSETLVAAVCERFDVGPGFTDYGTMLAEAAPDVVHVLTPPQTHRAQVLQALGAGAHVFVEKPIAPGFGDYAEMRDAALARGLLLTENYNYRYMATSLAALDLLQRGAVGELVNFDVTLGATLAAPGGVYSDRDVPHFAHELPGGVLQNFATHPASLLVAFAGSHEGVRVAQRHHELRAVVRTAGATAVLTLTGHVSRFALAMRAQGTKGVIEADLIEGRLHLDAGSSPLSRITGGLRRGWGQVASSASLVGRSLTSRYDYWEGLERLLGAYYAAVRGAAEPPISVAEMDATNRLVDALFDPANQL